LTGLVPTVAELPFIDEHETSAEATVDDVWAALLASWGDGPTGVAVRAVARVLGCADPAASGPRPLSEGSTVPGFRVASSIPGRELVLEGRHHFSTYALIFRLDAAAGRTRLRAESRGTFPGAHGRLYRLLVIGSRGHVVAVRRMLAGIRRRAEHGAR
jgi:hypothetical protein